MTARIIVILVALASVLGLFAGGSAVARQGADPTAEGTPDNELPPLPGQIAEAEREYRAGGARPTGIGQLLLAVGEFDTEAAVAEASAPTVGDESLALTGQIDHQGTNVFVAFLYVREGRFLYGLLGASLETDPLPDLFAIVERTIAGGTPEAGTPATGTPGAPSLLDRLPSLADLPPGLTLVDESLEVYDAAGSRVATPAA